jgi:hypothetical protein
VRRVTGRVALVALGAVGALIGLALAAAGIVLLVLTGHGGSVGGGEADLSTPRYALVSDAAGLGTGRLDATVRIRVHARGEGPVFVGVAPAAAVRAYLAGTGYDELADVRLSPLRATLVPSDGTAAPGRPVGGPRAPAWTASAAGTGEQTLDVPVRGGGQQLVIMKPDASAGVDVTAALALRAAFLRRLAIGLLVTGAVVAPLGGLALAAGVRQAVRTRTITAGPE